MIALDADARARILAHPLEGNGLRILGPSGAGKSALLHARRDALVRAHPDARIVAFSGTTGLGALARAVLAAYGQPRARIDDAGAEELFERCGAELYELAWSEFVTAEIDPEISGLRAPERFAAAAYRLIRKLRRAGIDPETFAETALRGAVRWYAQPPNLATPSLLFGTAEKYRDSLLADAAELERQRLREVDLAKILAKLYRSYVETLAASAARTDVDAVADAVAILSREAGARQRLGIAAAFIDDAEELAAIDLALVRAIFGETFAGVTFALDPEAAIGTFAGARPRAVLELALEEVVLAPPAPPRPARLRLHRAKHQNAEAQFVAAEVAALLESGVAAERIAVVTRSLRDACVYHDALVAANIPVVTRGDANLFEERAVLDALALAWSAVDPFRHEWLLRALQTATVRLADASLHVLCTEGPDRQRKLFETPANDDEARARWDRERDLRLGRNFTRGERDDDLSPLARERVVAFRAARARWEAALRTVPVAALLRLILAEGGLLAREPGENAASHRRRLVALERLVALVDAHLEREPRATLREVLTTCERLAQSEWPQEVRESALDEGAVTFASVEAVKGRHVDYVFVVNARSGGFAPYYAPDAFLFSPAHGMIPKDNVGDARASRTAKYTWYVHQAKVKEHYAAEDRRALGVAISRATIDATVSAGGRPTRGAGAPELLVELEARHRETAEIVNAATTTTIPRADIVVSIPPSLVLDRAATSRGDDARPGDLASFRARLGLTPGPLAAPE